MSQSKCHIELPAIATRTGSVYIDAWSASHQDLMQRYDLHGHETQSLYHFYVDIVFVVKEEDDVYASMEYCDTASIDDKNMLEFIPSWYDTEYQDYAHDCAKAFGEKLIMQNQNAGKHLLSYGGILINKTLHSVRYSNILLMLNCFVAEISRSSVGFAENSSAHVSHLTSWPECKNVTIGGVYNTIKMDKTIIRKGEKDE